MRGGPLCPQRLTLVHTEPVLLVNDDQPEVGKGRRVAQERVRAHDDARLPGCHAQRRTTPLGRRQLTGQQCRHELDRQVGAEHPSDRAQMLRSEHLGRSDERGLAAALGHLQHRAQRHERLARPDLTLNEPIHRPLADQIPGDLVTDSDLIRSSIEGQRGVEPIEECAGLTRGRRHRAHELSLLQQGRLQHQRLMPAQGLPRGLNLVGKVRAMDALERHAIRQQTMRPPQILGQRLRQIVEAVEDHPDELRDLPAGQRRGGRVDRYGKVSGGFCRRPRSVFVVEQLIVRVRELQRTAVLAHLAGEHPAPAGDQLSHPPRLVEERQGEFPVAVADHHLEQRTPAILHPSLGRPADFGDDRDRFADRQRRDGCELSAARVTAWVVLEQVTHRAHRKRTLECLGRFAAERAVQSRRQRESDHAPEFRQSLRRAKTG